jgi:hypothetical protein
MVQELLAQVGGGPLGQDFLIQAWFSHEPDCQSGHRNARPSAISKSEQRSSHAANSHGQNSFFGFVSGATTLLSQLRPELRLSQLLPVLSRMTMRSSERQTSIFAPARAGEKRRKKRKKKKDEHGLDGVTEDLAQEKKLNKF